MAGLSTHVLDTSRGLPAAGIPVELFFVKYAERTHLASAITNIDGRASVADALPAGIYELVFHAGDYLKSIPVSLSDPPFLDEVVIRFGVSNPDRKYHVPLLLAPWGYTTYLGS